MIHEEVINNWVYEHFLIYLYLCIADCDCIISDEELEEIKDKAIKSVDYCRSDSLLKGVYNEFRYHNSEEQREFIKEYASHFLRTDSIRKHVIHTLEESVHDKSSDSEEGVMFRFIRMVINHPQPK